MLSADELRLCIRGCTLNERTSQKKLYDSFFGYALAICNRYCDNQEDTIEILNDGFLKIFKEIYHFQPSHANELNSFMGWMKKIMINTAIDRYRKDKKHQVLTELDNNTYQFTTANEQPLDDISYDEIIKLIQQLSPGYRIVLNLFIIEGFSHEEIANQLGISIGTSKSNLAKARKQLQKILIVNDKLLKNAG